LLKNVEFGIVLKVMDLALRKKLEKKPFGLVEGGKLLPEGKEEGGI
jgi:hypothetical protein